MEDEGRGGAAAECLLASRLAAAVGTQWVEAVYAAVEGMARPAPTGPWDLRSFGVPAARQVRTVVAVADTPHAAAFPTASFAVQTEIEGAASAPMFRFYEERDDGWYWLGDGDRTLPVLILPPQRVLPRVLRVGQRWEQRYRDSRFAIEMTAEHEVVGCGDVRVPAGQFSNALLVRSTYRSPDSPAFSVVHAWHAPAIGIVATTTASSFVESTATVTVLVEYRPVG